MNSPFRFEPSQRSLIKNVAKHMRNVGYIWAVLSIFAIIIDGVELIRYLGTSHPVSVLDIFKKPMESQQFFQLFRSSVKHPFYVAVGIFAVKSSHFLYNIAEQKGEDLENLMGGLSYLRNSLLLLYIYALSFLAILWIRIIFF